MQFLQGQQIEEIKQDRDSLDTEMALVIQQAALLCNLNDHEITPIIQTLGKNGIHTQSQLKEVDDIAWQCYQIPK